MTKNLPFYAKGLSFSCTRCSDCCRHESGYVFLSENDVSRLACECQLAIDQFIKTYCRWIPSLTNIERLSLKEKADLDCIFWDSGCKVYNSRPLQCRVFPFWPDIMRSREFWERTGATCPGVDQGLAYSMEEIEALLDKQESEPAISRKRENL
ncbi:MAG: YkgJ family cysteine cluster protein [Treponema sp.]|jgi:Fe-S-cluster containining protein|nr:YkgJ family cysteine cluster protein [Treponema sp.]